MPEVEPANFRLLDRALKLQNPQEAAALVKAVWDTFPSMAEWQVQVGIGERIEQRGLTVAPGLEGRWRVHYPPIEERLWRRGLKGFNLAHHQFSFSEPIYLLAVDESPRHPPQAGFWKAIGWAPRETEVSVKDLHGWSEDVSANCQGIFWIRHWPPEDKD